MELLTTTILLLAAATLGLSAGALLAEGAVLVPFWRGVPPQEFLDWYRRHAALLLRFFGPLEGVAAGLAVAAALLNGRALSIFAALLSIAVLVAFPLYFKGANTAFAERSIGIEDVADELERWSAWHWGRTALATLAFLAAVAAVRD